MKNTEKITRIMLANAAMSSLYAPADLPLLFVIEPGLQQKRKEYEIWLPLNSAGMPVSIHSDVIDEKKRDTLILMGRGKLPDGRRKVVVKNFEYIASQGYLANNIELDEPLSIEEILSAIECDLISMNRWGFEK